MSEAQLTGPGSSGSARLLLLGASGFLGASLNFHLSRDPLLQVISLSRDPESENPISDYSHRALSEALERWTPDFVMNCVGLVGHGKVETSPDLARELNVFLPQLLAELSFEQKIRLIHFSSDAVYSGTPDLAPFSEDSPTAPFSLYGRQKLESETRVLDKNPLALVLRVNFFGWSRDLRSGLLDHFVSHAIKGSRPIGYRDYFASSLYVGELARTISSIVRSPLTGVFNVGSPDSLSKLEFGREVYLRMGLNPRQIIPGNPTIWAEEGVSSRDLSMSSHKIESSLSISLATQIESIQKALDDLHSFLDFCGTAGTDPRPAVLKGSQP